MVVGHAEIAGIRYLSHMAAVSLHDAEITFPAKAGDKTDQLAVARQPVQHGAAKRADAGAIFDEQLAIGPIDRR